MGLIAGPNKLGLFEMFMMAPTRGRRDGLLMVEVFDDLLETDGDTEAENDGGDVDEEVAQVMGGVVCRVNVEHGNLLLRILGCGRD